MLGEGCINATYFSFVLCLLIYISLVTLSLRLAATVPALVGIELVGISDLLWIEMCKVMQNYT